MRLTASIAAVLLLVLSFSASATIVYVDCSAPGTVHNGLRWSTAFLSINQALKYLRNGGEVWVKGGLYKERLLLNTYSTIYGGFRGSETSPAQRQIGAYLTVIDGQRAGTVITAPVGSRSTIDGLVICNGYADKGGGVSCGTNSIVNIRNCRVENCGANTLGGGVYFDTYTQGTMSNCIVDYNWALNGGGVVVQYHSYPTLQNTVIARNHAARSGGGLYCPFHSGALLINCTLACNVADVNGGAIYAYYGGPETFRYCIIAFNTALTGGGLFADGGSSSAVLAYCDWFGNAVSNVAGYITRLPSGSLSVDPMFVSLDRDDFRILPSSPCPTLGAYPLQ